MSFEAGLAAFKQNKFEAAIEQLLLYCQECDADGKVTSQKYMQAHIGLAKSYQKLGQFDQAIAHCQGLTETQNPALKIWIDKMLPKLVAAGEKANAEPEADAPDSPLESSSAPVSEPNEMLLQQGIQAYKNMKCDRAITLLEDYIKECTNHKSRNYMQAQMTLVKAYKETTQIQQAIARCEELSTSENFALKSWASKALPKLQKLLEPVNESVSPAPTPATSIASDAASSAPTPPSTVASPSTSTPVSSTSSASSPTSQPGELEQVASSSFTFDALPQGTSRSHANSSSASTSHSAPSSHSNTHVTTTRSTSPSRRTSPTRTSRTSKQRRNGSTAKIGFLGGAAALLFGRSLGNRLIWKGIGVVIGLIVAVARGCSGDFSTGFSDFQEAVIIGDKVAVERLIDQGQSLETTDEAGNTIIFWALSGDDCDTDWACQMSPNRQEIVQLLLDNGANVTITNDWQETPLHFAASIGDTADILRQIIDKGANVNALDSTQATPLHWAAGSGSTENIELLLNREADVNAKDADGYTPLDYAASDTVVKMLVSRGGISGL